jgi:hypothetical protein
MITVTRDDGRAVQFSTATRASTDEFNNLEVWTGREGNALIWICAVGHWVEVTLEADNGG